MSRLSSLLVSALVLCLAAMPQTASAGQKHKKHAVTKAAAAHKSVAVRKTSSRKVIYIKRRPHGGHLSRVSAQASTLDQNVDHPALFSSAALVVNAQSGERIYEKNSQSLAPIASITKLMTAIVTLDMHLPLDEQITITDADVDTLKNSSSRLMVGTTLTRGEVMHLALMASENRAAHALARTAPGGVEGFVARMNRTAQGLGMLHTRFEDPTGLTSANVSTAQDLIRLVQAAHQYPEIRSYSTSDSYSFVSTLNGREYNFHNTNPLVKNDAWQIGVSKTGYINEAGKCLVMQATINQTPVVIVLLDSAGKLTRIGDAQRIKKWLESSPGAMLRAG